MDKFIEELIEKGMGQLMDQSRDELMDLDKIHKEDSRREEEAEQQVRSLGLTEEQESVIDHYLDCMKTCNHRYADVSYMAGIRDTVRLLVSLNLLKEADMQKDRESLNCN